MEYSPAVRRHFTAPLRARELPGSVAGLVAGEAEDRTLHVWVRFQLQVVDNVVVAAGFQAFGCPHTVAAADVVAEWLEGRSVEEARRLDAKELCSGLSVPVEKLGKLLRIEDAVAACWRTQGRIEDNVDLVDG
jgi:NifU-like protein involved in Fe-S cluster formation